jgi:hypothetical protein
MELREGQVIEGLRGRFQIRRRCGSEVLYDSRAQLNGTSMSSWGVSENPVPWRAGVFSYQAKFSDTGTRTGERAQAMLDTAERQGIFFRETLPLYRVTLTVDPDSANRIGEPFLADNQPTTASPPASWRTKSPSGSSTRAATSPATTRRPGWISRRDSSTSRRSGGTGSR